ncbi:MAG TPA: transporter substrate-binding domain-containing protein [Caulobacteraceae bacterium]|jgi:polar amino acid transport system substrate-binding protein|nr:transporter substrate-binding domain-containing protein [Caulobacteraceae bacterium]
MIGRRPLLCAAVATALLLLAGCAGPPSSPRPYPPQATVVATNAEVRRSLAPTGKLRVGVYAGGPTSMVRDPVSGEAKGVAFDLGRELARRLGVPFQLVEFDRVAQVVDALRAGAVDFTITNATAARMQDADFSEPVLDVELGYLARAGSPVGAISDVDRPGVRICVTEGSSSQSVLSRQFMHATLVAAPSPAAAYEMMSSRQVDAYATNKPTLFELADRLQGARVLKGSWGLEHMAIAIPKGRGLGLVYARKFAQDARQEGLVQRAVERAGLRGAANTH